MNRGAYKYYVEKTYNKEYKYNNMSSRQSNNLVLNRNNKYKLQKSNIEKLHNLF